jgi:hypothetical protein
MGASMAAPTVTAYGRDWKAWVAYAAAHRLDALPADPSHVCAFLAAYTMTIEDEHTGEPSTIGTQSGPLLSPGKSRPSDSDLACRRQPLPRGA